MSSDTTRRLLISINLSINSLDVSVSVSISRRTLLGYSVERMDAKNIYLNTANDGASGKASPFHALIVLGGNDGPYWRLDWLLYSINTRVSL